MSGKWFSLKVLEYNSAIMSSRPDVKSEAHLLPKPFLWIPAAACLYSQKKKAKVVEGGKKNWHPLQLKCKLFFSPVDEYRVAYSSSCHTPLRTDRISD